MVLGNYICISQTLNKTDSCTCIPNSRLRIAAQKIEQGKADSVSLEACNTSNNLLMRDIDTKIELIDQLNKKDADSRELIANFLKEESNLFEQRTILTKSVVKLNKQVKRAKRTTILGVLGTGALGIFLLIIKK